MRKRWMGNRAVRRLRSGMLPGGFLYVFGADTLSTGRECIEAGLSKENNDKDSTDFDDQ
jgi:hypothetical protein